jgi:hypothetical protein
MALNIVEEVQKDMGFEHLEKVDPNTQEPASTEVFTSPVSATAQGAIPAVLAAFYKKTRTEADAATLIDNAQTGNYLHALYGDNDLDAVEEVAEYSKITRADAGIAMEKSAAATMEVLRAEVKDFSPKAVSEFFTDQRTNILHYLPASLHMGQLLDDNTIDDRTHKMEGPVSGMMHAIESVFSSSK